MKALKEEISLWKKALSGKRIDDEFYDITGFCKAQDQICLGCPMNELNHSPYGYNDRMCDPDMNTLTEVMAVLMWL